MSNEISISDAEWVVMDVVWTRSTARAADVVDDLAQSQSWNHRTIRTLLARLVEKGALHAIAEGHRYVYSPAVTRQRCVRVESRSFLEKVFAGDVGTLMLHFARESRMSAVDIQRLKQMLEE
ncbi:MAG: BlaI/MecI/CopY family transcriptional regulator [Planctomycetaceae bacterium]|nr:BlaI/MecI/CopY family transcriptional regulator [Planctomycetaceae bacterium]